MRKMKVSFLVSATVMAGLILSGQIVQANAALVVHDALFVEFSGGDNCEIKNMVLDPT